MTYGADDEMKVWSGLMHGRGQVQAPTVVAATSQKAACAILNRHSRMSLYEFRNYWSETGNAIDIEAAMSDPGAVFQASDSRARDYAKVSA